MILKRESALNKYLGSRQKRFLLTFVVTNVNQGRKSSLKMNLGYNLGSQTHYRMVNSYHLAFFYHPFMISFNFSVMSIVHCHVSPNTFISHFYVMTVTRSSCVHCQIIIIVFSTTKKWLCVWRPASHTSIHPSFWGCVISSPWSCWHKHPRRNFWKDRREKKYGILLDKQINRKWVSVEVWSKSDCQAL